MPQPSWGEIGSGPALSAHPAPGVNQEQPAWALQTQPRTKPKFCESGFRARGPRAPSKAIAEPPFGSAAILGSFVASAAACACVAKEARTRGFAAPAFAGWALIEVSLR
jgi:hypothetical protein